MRKNWAYLKRVNLDPISSASARIANLFGDLNKDRHIFLRDDKKAIYEDWHSVGKEIQLSIENYGNDAHNQDRTTCHEHSL